MLEPVYEWLGFDFSEGLVEFCRDGKCGIMDRNFQLAFDPQFDRQNDLTEGYHCGRTRFLDKDRKYGYLNTKGQAVIPPIYDDAAFEFKHGLASVALGDRRETFAYGVIDTNGNVVVPLEYTRAEVVKPGIVKLHRGRRYGYLKLPDTWIWQPTE